MATLTSNRSLLLIGLALVGIPWLAIEWMLDAPAVLWGVRLGLGLGIAAFPLLVAIYRRSFRGRTRQAMEAVGLSFVLKGLFLGGAGVLAWRWLSVPVSAVIIPLFYALFTLGFIAISVAWFQRSNHTQGQ